MAKFAQEGRNIQLLFSINSILFYYTVNIKVYDSTVNSAK
jgi:hypothetical protein